MNTCKFVSVDRNDKPTKKKVSPEIRFKLWEKYVGNNLMVDCFCCYKNKITPITNYMTFQAGHIRSEFNDGIISLDNMLPICKGCNVRMYTTNWDDYVNSKKMYIPRLYGGDIPQSTHTHATEIQSWWRNLKSVEIIKKRKPLRKYLKGYEILTYTFMKKRRKKVRVERKLIWH